MKRIDTEEVLKIHSMLISATGGIDGVRDKGMLISALNAPFQTFMGEELYPSIEKKAAALCYGLINNHAFTDGNKRIGILVMLTFLELNGIDVNCTDENIIRLGVGVADGSLKTNDIERWIIKYKEN